MAAALATSSAERSAASDAHSALSTFRLDGSPLLRVGWSLLRGTSRRQRRSSRGKSRSGMEVRVVGRQSGWVQIANSDGSQTGWLYEKLVEPVDGPNEHTAGTEAAQPDNGS